MPAADASIELAVYACSADALLFVPAVCLPPRDAELAFGPLARLANVHVHDVSGAWRPVLSQIERHLFATVSRPEAELLVGLRRLPPSAANAPTR